MVRGALVRTFRVRVKEIPDVVPSTEWVIRGNENDRRCDLTGLKNDRGRGIELGFVSLCYILQISPWVTPFGEVEKEFVPRLGVSGGG